jgi:hypothetical protein
VYVVVTTYSRRQVQHLPSESAERHLADTNSRVSEAPEANTKYHGPGCPRWPRSHFRMPPVVGYHLRPAMLKMKTGSPSWKNCAASDGLPRKAKLVQHQRYSMFCQVQAYPPRRIDR